MKREEALKYISDVIDNAKLTDSSVVTITYNTFKTILPMPEVLPIKQDDKYFGYKHGDIDVFVTSIPDDVIEKIDRIYLDQLEEERRLQLEAEENDRRSEAATKFTDDDFYEREGWEDI